MNAEMSAVPAHSLYYDEPTYARLSAINKVVDPGRIFWNSQAVDS